MIWLSLTKPISSFIIYNVCFSSLTPLSVGHTQHTEKIKQQFENTDISLSTITLLSPEIKDKLKSFSAKADFDSTAITQKVGIIYACIFIQI